jgi:hypothetical protein
MNHHYADIRGRIADPPKWWDENAVPRWSEFSPRETADIYAMECALIRIECQNCEREFDVAMSRSNHDYLVGKRSKLADSIARDEIHWGDPPNIDCCPSGPTMNSVERRVLQFWRQNSNYEWERVPELEREIGAFWREEESTSTPNNSDASR